MIRTLVIIATAAIFASSSLKQSSREYELSLLEYYRGNIQLTEDSIISLAHNVNNESNNTYLLALSRFQIGYWKDKNGDYSSIYDYLDALRLSANADTTDLWIEIQSRNYLGQYYYEVGEYHEAIKWYKEALPYALDLQNVPKDYAQRLSARETATLKMNMANAMGRLGLPGTVDLYNEAYEIAQEQHLTKTMLQIKYNLGYLFSNPETAEIAVRYFDEIIAMKDLPYMEKYQSYVGKAYREKADLLLQSKRYDEALAQLQLALPLVDGNWKYLTLMDMGECYLALSQPEQAISACTSALEYYPTDHLESKHLKVYQHLASAYSDNPAKQNEYLQIWARQSTELLQLKEQLALIARRSTLHRMADDYYKTLQIHNQDREYRELLFASILVTLLASAFIAYRRYRRRNQINNTFDKSDMEMSAIKADLD